MIDVITTKFFPCFKMAASFENLDSILHDWTKNENNKSIVEALNSIAGRSIAGRRKIKPFFSSKMAQKKYSSSRQSSETII